MKQLNVETRIRRQLTTFAAKSGITDMVLRPTTNLLKDFGFSSLQGLEFVLDLCDEFGLDFPSDFNPFVNDEGRRGRTYQELITVVETHLASQGVSHGEK